MKTKNDQTKSLRPFQIFMFDELCTNIISLDPKKEGPKMQYTS